MTTSIMGGQLGTKAVSLGQLDNFLDWLVDGKDSKLPKDLYAAVAWNFWAVNLRADSIAQVPYAVYPMELPEGDETEDNTVEFDIDLTSYLWAAEAWLQLMGAAYWLKRANRVGLQTLQVLNSQTMKLKTWGADGPKTFEQKVGAQTQLYRADEIVYFRTFSPDTDLGPGISSGHVAATESTLIKNANEWAAKFFEKGAIPSVILSTDQAIPDSELERVRNVWEKFTMGVANAWRTVVLRSGLKPTVIGMPVKDLAMPELERTKKEQILAAHGIPPGLAEAKTNRAEREGLQFELWSQCIKPEVQIRLKPVINTQLLNPMGLRIKWRFNKIEAIQRAEIGKAESASFLFNGMMIPAYDANLVSIEEARAVLGAILDWVDLPVLQDTFEPEERTPPPMLAAGGNGGEEGDQGRPEPRGQTPPKALAPTWGLHRVSTRN